MPPQQTTTVDTPTNGELMRQIQALTSKVDVGFQSVGAAQKTASDKEDKNTEFRLKAEGALNTFKWLFGLLGIGNIALLIKVFLLH